MTGTVMTTSAPKRARYTKPAPVLVKKRTGTDEEVKALDAYWDAASVLIKTNTNTNGLLLNPVVSGASYINRIGRKIRIKSLRVNWALYPQAYATALKLAR